MPMQRTAAGLRELLFEQIDGLRAGKVSPTDAKAIAAVAGTILKSVEVEMAFREQQKELRADGVEIGEMSLAQLPAPEEVKSGAPRLVRGRAMSASE